MPDNNEWIINPLPEIGPINSVVPWTYGDAYSFLEILTETREKMQEILKGFKIQDKHIRDFVNDVSNKINEFVAKFVHHTVTEDDKGIIHFAMMNGSEVLTYTVKQFDKVFGEYKGATDKKITDAQNALNAALATARQQLTQQLNALDSRLTRETGIKIKEVRDFADKKANRYYHVVTDYGAVGDGTADDSEAIEKAIASAGKGGHIYFPKGIYRVTRTLTFLPDQYIEGTSGSWGDNVPNSAIRFDIRDGKGVYCEYGNVFERMRFDGPGFNILGAIGLHIKSYATVRDCGFYRWDRAVYCEQNWYTEIERCKWYWNNCAIDINYCYNIAIVEPHIIADRGDRRGVDGIRVREGSMIRITGGAIEAYQTAISMEASCSVLVTGCYFETDKQITAEQRRGVHFKGGNSSLTMIGCQVYVPNHKAFVDATTGGAGENINMIGNFYKGGVANEDAGFIIDTNESNPGAMQIVAIGENNTNTSHNAYRYVRPRMVESGLYTFPYRAFPDRGGNKTTVAGKNLAVPLGGAVVTGYGDALPSFGDEKNMWGAMFWHAGKNKLCIFTPDGWKATDGTAI